jgi:hypothetical protein
MYENEIQDREHLLQLDKRMHSEDISVGHDISSAHLLITLKAKGRTLSDWVNPENNLFTKTSDMRIFLYEVLLQIAYTLLVFKDFGFMHNDLHTANVFVEKLESPLHYSINIGDDKTIAQNISYFVRIFDFDLSAKMKTAVDKTVLRNTKLEKSMCSNYGLCNVFNENMDWFTVLAFLVRDNGTLRPMVETLVDPELLHQKYNGRNLVGVGNPCFCRSSKLCKSCILIPLVDEVIVSPTTYLLQSHEIRSKIHAAFSRPQHVK